MNNNSSTAECFDDYQFVDSQPESFAHIPMGGGLNIMDDDIPLYIHKEIGDPKKQVASYLRQVIKMDKIQGRPLKIEDYQIQKNIGNLEKKISSVKKLIRDVIDSDRILVSFERQNAVALGQCLENDNDDLFKQKLKDKTVVIVAPAKNLYGRTDARFSLGFSLGAMLNTSHKGVFLADRGRFYCPTYTYYNPDKDLFLPQNENGCNGVIDNVRFLITGGTIDGKPNYRNDGFIETREQSFIADAFNQDLKLQFKWKHDVICMKDSRDIAEEDRQRIMQTIQECKQRIIIITHGTYALPETANYISDKIDKAPEAIQKKLREKIILLLGGMRPLTDEYSDADYNLGYAIGRVSQEVKNEGGVFVAMNSHFYPAGHVDKNLQKGIFEYT